MTTEKTTDITFEIKERICVLSQQASGWSKECNLVSWNGKAPKYDIRDWDPTHEHMSKGLCLTEHQARILVDALSKYFAD